MFKYTIGHVSLIGTHKHPVDTVEDVVLCVHGMFGGAWYFKDWMLQWAHNPSTAAYALDLRLHGESGHPHPRGTLGKITLREYVDDVSIALSFAERQHKGARVHLLGHSMGALLTYLAAGRVASEQVLTSSIFVAPAAPAAFASVTPIGAWYAMRYTFNMMWGLPISPEYRSARRLIFNAMDEVDAQDYFARLTPESGIAARQIVAGSAGKLRPPSNFPPSLVVRPVDDAMVPVGAARWFGKYLPRAEEISVPGGHMCMLGRDAPVVATELETYFKHCGAVSETTK